MNSWPVLVTALEQRRRLIVRLTANAMTLIVVFYSDHATSWPVTAATRLDNSSR